MHRAVTAGSLLAVARLLVTKLVIMQELLVHTSTAASLLSTAPSMTIEQ